MLASSRLRNSWFIFLNVLVFGISLGNAYLVLTFLGGINGLDGDVAVAFWKSVLDAATAGLVLAVSLPKPAVSKARRTILRASVAVLTISQIWTLASFGGGLIHGVPFASSALFGCAAAGTYVVSASVMYLAGQFRHSLE